MGTVCTALPDWCITWAFPMCMETTQGFCSCIYSLTSLSPLMILVIFKSLIGGTKDIPSIVWSSDARTVFII